MKVKEMIEALLQKDPEDDVVTEIVPGEYTESDTIDTLYIRPGGWPVTIVSGY